MDDVEKYFGVDPKVRVPIEIELNPPFEGEPQLIEETEGSRIERLPDGMIWEVQKAGIKTIPHYIKFPIENRDDWRRFKERLDPNDPARHQVNYRELGEELLRTDLPTGIGLGSYFGRPRDWIGFENIALMCYDDRGLVEEIVATLTELYYTQIEAALQYVEADYAAGWEDICFRNGPIVSPAMFRDIVGPHLKRVCRLLREHGCDVIWTDCDGDITLLIPVWMECGLNCMFPLEVHPGSDPVKYRKMYGREVLLRGGLRKYAFAGTKKDVLDELRRVEHVVADGGFIPHGDHRIPQDVPYDNYRYYVREKLSMLGWRNDEIAQIEPLKGVRSLWAHGK
jgi:uroporphyrinogen decarboxylase